MESKSGVSSGGQDTLTVYASLLRGALRGDKALAASQQMFQLVTESIPQAIFWKDRDLRFLGCNKVFADVAGLDPSDIIGKSDHDLPWAGTKADDYQEWDRKVMDRRAPSFNIEEPIIDTSGQIRWLETNKVPLIDVDGEVVGVLGTFQDVTSRRHDRLELREALSELDDRVQRRTAELSAANAALRLEVAERGRLQRLESQQRAYAEALCSTATSFNQAQEIDEVLRLAVNSLSSLVTLDVAAVLLEDAEDQIALAHYELTQNAALVSDDPEGSALSIAAATVADNMTGLLDEVSLRGACLGQGSRTVLLVPVHIAGERKGFMVAERTNKQRFDDDEIKTIRFVADQAAAALTSLRLIDKATELAGVNERQRLSRDLHDAVSQTLWTATLKAEALSELSDSPAMQGELQTLRELSRGALAEMRNLLLELRPTAIVEMDLASLVHQLIDAFASRKDCTIHRNIEDVTSVSTASKLALYRIVQEALNNTSRHASPTTVTVSVRDIGAGVEIQICDDGGGFDQDHVPAGHFGVRIMAERAQALGGTCVVRSDQNETTVCASVPKDGHERT